MTTETLTTIRTNVPARLDRLPWARWHWLVVIGLGTVWILDGLEVTIVGALASRLTTPESGLGLSDSQVGQAAACYVAGAVAGSLFFGRLTDRHGRKRLFLITLGLYLVATVATAFSVTALFFFACRFFTGAGIGGEYAAINSAIDELIPARVRGRVDLIINGSYWLGAAAGAALTLVLLDPSILPANLGWRLSFGLGAVLGLAILLVRRRVPESPRWLFIHGHDRAADDLVSGIEREVERETGQDLEQADEWLTVRQRHAIPFSQVFRTVAYEYPRRFVLGLSLFVGQAFLYNAVFFTQALVLTTFFKVSDAGVGLYLIPLALGNFLGPLLLGRLFDTIGRRSMIVLSYLGSGVLLIGTGLLLNAGVLDATTLTVCWCVVFFFASAGASAAYLTVSEIFPMEVRALAIALFYSIGTGLGGIIGPLLFGRLVESGSPGNVALGYYLGAILMIAAGVIELVIGVEAAQRPLEELATPLTAADAESAEGPEPEPAAAARPAAPARVTGRSASRSGYSPLQVRSTYPMPYVASGGETARLLAALDDGPLPRDALYRRAGANRWGPGRFSLTLRAALARGLVVEEGRGRYRRASSSRAQPGG